MADEILLKTDKNGTKYYVSFKCEKCGGTGFLDCYDYVDGGRCFKCGGTGEFEHHWKEYTPEYAETLRAKRAKKENEKKQKLWAEQFPQNKVWFVLGDTFNIKEQIKADGGKFNRCHGWYFTEIPNAEYTLVDENTKEDEVKGYILREVNAEEAFTKELNKYNQFLANNKYDVGQWIQAGSFIGTVGEKIEMEVTYTEYHSYEVKSSFSYHPILHSVYIFKDKAGNTLVWDTTGSSSVEYVGEDGYYHFIEKGSKVILKGRIKEHKEYKGVKQTMLQRCSTKLA